MSKLRKTLFWAHLATGVTVGAVVFIMCVTGVLLAYERQLINYFDERSIQSFIPGSGPTLPLPVLYGKIQEAQHANPTAITWGRNPHAPVQFAFGRDRVVFADPSTGQVVGEGSHTARVVFGAITDWHRWLAGRPGAARNTGRSITGACNLAFLGLITSGAILWFPRRWNWQSLRAVVFFRRGLTGRARDWNWHNVLGVWSAVPLFLIVATAVVMSYAWANNLLYRATGNVPPAQQGPSQRMEQSAGERTGQRGGPRRHTEAGNILAGLDLLVLRAAQEFPNWQTMTLRVPPGEFEALQVAVEEGNGGRPDKRSQIILDRKAEGAVRVERFAGYNAGRRLRAWVRFTHTGEAGGLAGQTLAAIFTASGACLVLTGISLSLRRFWRWKFKQSQNSDAAVYADMRG